MLPLLPHYTHIINPRLKHIYLKFDDAGNLIIKSPKVSQRRIEQILLKKSAWINRAREKIASQKGRGVDFSEESELYYLGDAYPLQLLPHGKKRTTLLFEEESFTLKYHAYDEGLFEAHINRFYKAEAQRVVPPLVEKWAGRMQLFPTKISFRKTKRQWGSCSAKNALSFNTMMMKLPQNVIEYIIVHELAHIAHKHHQKPFWELVEKHLPEYKTYIATLKTYR
ncbi:M48 family metallopeptidase [Sulfurovum mangrovi]|uniref:M48 family metallopeptidase n=1 Tax=Sulfurovum mangrovi TaxID=2893889 RepID=UPI001E3E4189|nr:SprT family zinc-dependent metalloprotease [Sulfurovum mangrovi]UFH59178.1 M48 family metallopeptidase [Sulfurovum mangrovi]